MSNFAPYLLPLFPSFNDDFEQNTIGKRWGAKSLRKKRGGGGCKVAQLAKDRGKSAFKPKSIIFFVKEILGELGHRSSSGLDQA